MIDDMDTNMQHANFIASFPPIQSAIKIAGNGDGMRVQLDIPESEMGEAVKLLQWREVLLQIRIEPLTGNTYGVNHGN